MKLQFTRSVWSGLPVDDGPGAPGDQVEEPPTFGPFFFLLNQGN